jgi:ribulose-phosphate 3-epimerase
MRDKIKLAPSILSADFARLGQQVAEATEAGADYIHVDVMDGHFVHNITIGAPVVQAIRSYTSVPLDVHLMVESPGRHIRQFAEAGADIITIHAEVCPHLHQMLEQIKALKVKAGVSINPGTSLAVIDEALPMMDLVLLMTVDPGFGGQLFIKGMEDKIARLRHTLDDRGLGAELEVDGGITAETAPLAVRAGARVLVAGSAIFNQRESVAAAMARIMGSLELES